MGYSDQKYYTRQSDPVSDPVAFTGTMTASGTNSIAASAYRIPTFGRKTKVNSIKLVIRTAPAANTAPVLTFQNGTNVFATATITGTAGAEANAVMTNTASTAVTTQTVTYANGGTAVSTVTTTTDWSVFAAGTGPTVVIGGTTTASGASWGAYAAYLEAQENFV
jgi:hypothetical protein